jgi:Small-conductance mechanosensitive channel
VKNWENQKTIVAFSSAILIGIAVISLFDYFYVQLSLLFHINPNYSIHVHEAVIGIIILIITILTLKIIKNFFNRMSTRSNNRLNLNGMYVIIRIVVYIIAISIFLALIGLDIEGAIVGGTVGGIVLGLAVQSVTSSILAGIMVTAGGFLKPGESISIYSSSFPETILGTVDDIRTLNTRIVKPDGTTALIPNTILFGNSIFTRLGEGDQVRIPFKINVHFGSDANKIISDVEDSRADILRALGIKDFKCYLLEKSGFSNIILFIITGGMLCRSIVILIISTISSRPVTGKSN